MSLAETQQRFTFMVGQLISRAYELKYKLTFGDAYRSPDNPIGKPTSLHRLRLAADFNLFIDGEYQTATDAYQPLGEYWESLGGAWGGRFGDGNHFSLEHEGRR